MANKHRGGGGGSLSDFLEQMPAISTAGKFKPFAWYNNTGDSIEIYLSPDHHISERVNSLFTMFVSPDDPTRVVGLAIKDIKKHFGESGLSDILVKAGRATVKLLVYGALIGVEIHHLARDGSPTEAPSDVIQSLLADHGDTLVPIENAKELQLT